MQNCKRSCDLNPPIESKLSCDILISIGGFRSHEIFAFQFWLEQATWKTQYVLPDLFFESGPDTRLLLGMTYQVKSAWWHHNNNDDDIITITMMTSCTLDQVFSPPQLLPEEVRQEAGPDVIWGQADAAWLHSFHVWTLHWAPIRIMYSSSTDSSDHGQAYFYLHSYLSSLFVSILSGESKALITMTKARVQQWKASTLISIRIVLACDHLIYDLRPCRTSSDLLLGPAYLPSYLNSPFLHVHPVMIRSSTRARTTEDMWFPDQITLSV